MKKYKYPLQWFGFMAGLIIFPAAALLFSLDYVPNVIHSDALGSLICLVSFVCVFLGWIVGGIEFFNWQDRQRKKIKSV